MRTLIAATLLLAACGQADEKTAANPAAPDPVAATEPVAAVVETAESLTAEQVVRALQADGMKLTDVVIYTAETDDNQLLGRPGQYVSKANFNDARHPQTTPESTIEVFATVAEAERRRDYVAGIGEGMPMFVQYQVLIGKTLARLNKALTPSEAAAYEKALGKILT